MVAGIVNRMDFIFVSAPNVRRPEDLKGKRIAISQFGTASHHGVLLGLRRWDLEPAMSIEELWNGSIDLDS